MIREQHDPKNPYLSFALDASAGCGKTYQLAFRFLYLVGAGADPSKILTITFTKAAAAEMKDRIFSYASKLLSDLQVQKDFEIQLQQYMQVSNTHHCKYIKPHQVAEYIFDKASELQISTIDSLFLRWIKKFLYETLLQEYEELNTQQLWTFDFASLSDSVEFTAKAWQNLCDKYLDKILRENPKISEIVSQCGFITLKNWIMSLFYHDTYLWFCKKIRQDKYYINPIDINAQLSFASIESYDDLCEQLLPYFEDLLNKSSAQSKLYYKIKNFLDTKDWATLKNEEILNAKDQISGKYFRGPFRDKVQDSILAINSIINAFKKHKLNQYAKEISSVYDVFIKLRNIEKYQNSTLEFSDLSKGCFNLFFDEQNIGIRFLLTQNIQHILIDELQDTNMLQWFVFRELCKEILAGEGVEHVSIDKTFKIKPTVFIVGDKKQSIYGFRDADPQVMDEAYETLSSFEVQKLPMSYNFRSAQIILDYVNMFFSDKFENFYEHKTAVIESEQVVPNYGLILVRKPFINTQSSANAENISLEDEDIEDFAAEELEAQYVAKTLSEILSDKKYLVFDKQHKTFRPIEPKDCAILYRAKTKSELFEKALREYQIPYYKEGSGGFFERTEIQDMIALVKWLAFPSDILSLATVLKSPIFAIDDVSLLRLLNKVHYESSKDNILNELQHIAFAVYSDLVDVVNKTKDLILPHKILTYVVYKLKLLDKYKNAFINEIDCELACANILQFLELCLELQRNGCTTLVDLTIRIEDLVQLSSEDTGDNDISNAKISSNAVCLMTIHKSKGLEFPLVFLVDCARDWDKLDRYWLKTRKDQTPGISFIGSKQIQPCDDTEFDIIIQKIKDEVRIENLRVLYVALTRAQNYLFISGHLNKNAKFDENNLLWQLYECAKTFCTKTTNYEFEETYEQVFIKNLKPQEHFLEPKNIISLHQVSEKETEYSKDEIYNINKLISSWDKLDLNIFNLKVIKPHHLILYDEDDTLKFYNVEELYPVNGLYSDLIKNQHLIYGTLVHKGLELAVKNNLNLSYETFLKTSQLILKFDDKNTFLNLVQKSYEDVEVIINSYNWKKLFDKAKNVYTELPVVYCNPKGEFINGVIDLLIEYPQEVWIIDYKTTRNIENIERFSLQLNTYAQAIKSIYSDLIVKTKIFLTFNQQFYDI